MNLFAYKMTDDSGFAPNPFHGILSLATCKAQIRESKRLGSWIAGFTSKELCGAEIGKERLVYIMKVTEKIDFNTYYHDPRFRAKRVNSETRIGKSGDNIYHLTNGKFKQERNFFHKEKDAAKDLKSKMVLLSKHFYYFGRAALSVNQFQINVPDGQSSQGYKTTNEDEILGLLEFIKQSYPKNIPIAAPHFWEEGEPFN